ncbi:hypothetical protein [Streptomyces sp. NPDC001816]|uniref:hypothetical protein n=1 Tax=Streptomyces sp. NPDC001816 TaxID=3364612 RepID=UPI0036B6BC2E
MSLRDFLERFRPVGTPGASATGVPADRTAERAAELEPTLAQLTGVQQEAAGIRAAADEAAEAVRRDTAREAERLVAAARERAAERMPDLVERAVADALRLAVRVGGAP